MRMDLFGKAQQLTAIHPQGLCRIESLEFSILYRCRLEERPQPLQQPQDHLNISPFFGKKIGLMGHLVKAIRRGPVDCGKKICLNNNITP